MTLQSMANLFKHRSLHVLDKANQVHMHARSIAAQSQLVLAGVSETEPPVREQFRS